MNYRMFCFKFLIFFSFSLSFICRIKCKEKICWVVVTTINHPTKALKKLAQLEDWQLLVIGDKKTPLDWHLDNCIYLGVEDQLKLDYKIIDLLPWNHYSRKNIGYLYAIERGAKIIYDTDDDNILIDSTIHTLAKDEKLPLYTGTKTTLNPYGYFHSEKIWPRGYPLSKILSDGTFKFITETEFDLTQATYPYVQQGLADLDPDVDAILRLTKGVGSIVFDKTKKPIALPKGCFCPFNTQNTVIHNEAFWGLLIPITTAFRVCDIWRGYWTQRLLWDIGGHLAFTTATVFQERNDHNLKHDFIDEIDLYTKTEALIETLLYWKSTNNSFFSRIKELTSLMIEQNFYKEKELALVEAWLSDLKEMSYEEPSIIQ